MVYHVTYSAILRR